MCERMRDVGLHNLGCAVGVHEDPFSLFEPLESVGWETFSANCARVR